MTSTSPFTLADAQQLRADACGISAHTASDFAAGTAPLQRYTAHYGFEKLLQSHENVLYRLRFERWANYAIARHSWELDDPTSAKGTVVVVHGLFDHVGLYLPLVEHLLGQGLNVVAFDLPGHGLSDGAPAAITAFREYSDVLGACINSCAELPGPYHAVGQSTGCSAIVDYLFQSRRDGKAKDPLDKIVLLAPLVRARAWWQVSLLHSVLGKLLKHVPRHFGGNSHDKDFLHFLEHEDPLQARQVSTEWVNAMRHWERIFRKAPDIAAQLLIVQGTADATVDWRWNVPHLQEHITGAQVRYVEGAHHHLVRESAPWQTEVFAAVTRYLNRAKTNAKS